MKIKTKLTLGVGLLFILIILLSIVAAKYIHDLKDDTDNILVANYSSLQYCNSMMNNIDDADSMNVSEFEKNLHNQENNISEIGEKEATQELRTSFNEFIQNRNDKSKIKHIQNNLFNIMEMNMQAIQRKSETAKATADDAVFWIVLTGTMCFLIAFILLINLPSNIANPIKELTESIKKIANRQYSERVHFEGHNEFGELATSFNVMAKKLEEFNNSNLAKLMMEKKRIDALINNMHDPVIGLDEQMKVIFANQEAIKICGIQEDEFIGKSSKELALRNDLIRSLIQDLSYTDSKLNQKSSPIKIFADNKEGYFEKVILHIEITPTGEQAKQLIGHVIILRNITEYKELDFAKTNFIATVSHEFKTPISSIKMSLQLLENDQIGKLNEEQANLLKSIKEDANRLLKITAELLNMTQVESGNIQLTIQTANPLEIVQYALNATQTQADQKHIVFKIDCPDNSIRMQADPEKTAWVITNLISNAIRYSADNSTIDIQILKVDSKIQIAVRDFGQGISDQYKDKIFDRYFKVPGTKMEGTGLGLAISKEFIEAQEGQIHVESEIGIGSTFSILLNSSS